MNTEVYRLLHSLLQLFNAGTDLCLYEVKLNLFNVVSAIAKQHRNTT